MTYEPVALPYCEPGCDPATVVTAVDGWVRSRPMRDLVRHFGGPELDGDLDTVFAALGEFSAAVWDFRGGRERHRAQDRALDGGTTEVVRTAATALGLVTPTRPRYDRYDHVLILGGLIRACLRRTGHAAALLSDGLAATDVAALGSFRPVTEEELAIARAAGLDPDRIDTEFAQMAVGLERAFAPAAPPVVEVESPPESAPNQRYRVLRYRDGERTLRVLAAPSTEPHRRANTADTYAYWAEQVAHLSSAARVLVVTYAIYVPFQHADAVRILGLGYGCGVDTVGLDPSAGAPDALLQTFTPTNLLQEIRSGIISLWNLYDAATAARRA
jgi:hypothetical protein